MNPEPTLDTLSYRLDRLEDTTRVHETSGSAAIKLLGLHEEQINGKRGIQKTLDDVYEEVQSLKRAIIVCCGGIITSAITLQLLQTYVFSK